MADKPIISPDGTYVLDDALIQSIEETSLTGIIRQIDELPESVASESAGQAELDNPVLIDNSFVDYD